MKKILAILLALCVMMALVACGANKSDETTPSTTAPSTTPAPSTPAANDETEPSTPNTDPNFSVETVMDYEAYMAAEVNAEVTIEATIQAKQKYNTEYENTSLYTQDEDGAYFVYRMPCTEEEYAKLTVGTVVRVTGIKKEWNGEVEIAEDITFEIVENAEPYIAETLDVTELLGTDALIDNMNKKVSFTGMTVAPSTDAEGNEVAFLYNWDGSGSKGDDLSFNVSYNGATYNFCIESDLCNSESEVYAAVEALKVGDVINMEGFLYWYEGANPHITSVTVAE